MFNLGGSAILFPIHPDPSGYRAKTIHTSSNAANQAVRTKLNGLAFLQIAFRAAKQRKFFASPEFKFFNFYQTEWQ